MADAVPFAAAGAVIPSQMFGIFHSTAEKHRMDLEIASVAPGGDVLAGITV